MNVTLFQTANIIEPYFWTKEQIDGLNLHFDSENDRVFSIDDIHYKWKHINDNRVFNFNFEFEDGINLIVIHEDYDMVGFENFIKNLHSLKGSNKIVYIVFSKLTEDYWAWHARRTDDSFLKELSTIGNVKVIWDIPFYKLDNFIFSPKVHIQSYFLNRKFGGEAWYWGRDVFLKYPKEYRVGLHINKISNQLRFKLVKILNEYKTPQFFYTVNSDCPYNKRTEFGDLTEYTNFKSSVYRRDLQPKLSIGTFNNWYTAQFLELGIKSEMEVVYETFTYTDNSINELWLIKWNEKTIKHLYLGKPFIHSDPIAHKLMYEYGMKPYRSLYTDKLWDMYENWDINVKNVFSFIELIKENIDWLCNMPEEEWRGRIGEAMEVAKWNKNKVDELIFNTSLIDIVKSDIY